MIKSITVTENLLELKSPFVTALRRVISYPVITVRIEMFDGRYGYGECVATPQISGDSHDLILRELNSSAIQNLSELSPEIISALPFLPSTKAALDMALWCLQTPVSGSVKTDVTVPIAEISDLKGLVEQRVAAGFDCFKVKVEQSSITDLLQRIAVIREVAGEAAQIRIDPNQAWSLKYAISAARELAKTGANIEYLEQPLPKQDLAGHAALASECEIPLMADESCFSTADLDAVVGCGAFKYLNVKLLKAGGVVPAMELATRAKEAGLLISIGSMMEGELGIKAAIYVAQQVAPDTTHDLDAAWWFKDSSIKYTGSIVQS
jgi:L-alanine-DL-glutamate epimerase-like enolase superfamily enzyme